MKRVLLTVIASAVLLTGCGLKKDVVIKINNKDITKSQFEQTYKKAVKNSQLAQMGIDVPKDEDNMMYLMVKDRVINELIVKELINQEMDKRNINISKKDTESERQKMIDKIGSKEKFNELLKQNGITNSQFEEDLAQEIRMKKLIDIIHPVKISDSEAKAYYNKNISKFKYPDKVRASHILIAANPVEIRSKIQSKNTSLTEQELNLRVQAEMLEKYKKAQDIANQIKSTPDRFEAMAREVSDDTITAKNGGDIGFFAKADMIKPFADVAFKQRPNTISDVVQTQYGFHIIKVTDRMAAGQEPFEKIKEQLKLFLAAQEQVKALEQYIAALKKQAVIQYVDESYNPIKIEEKMKKLAEERKAAMKKMKSIPNEAK